jgi:4-coumarate--CoA ligase
MAEKILHGPKMKSLVEMTSLGEFFFKHAEKYRDNICQIDANIDKSETYSSVKRRSVRLAIALQKMGVTSRDVVLSCSYNSLDNSIPILSTLYLGAKIVNLDPSLGLRNSKHLITYVSPRIIFVEEASVGMVEECLKGTDLKPGIIVYGNSDKYAKFADVTSPQEDEEKFRPTKVDIHDTAVMLFSSGTTGLPKAICHSHYSFLQLVDIGAKYGFHEASILHFTTFYWMSGMEILARCFLRGGVRVFSGDVDGETILKIVQKYELLAIFMAPIYSYKLTRIDDSKKTKYDTSSLRCILTGGTPLSGEQLKRLKVLFPNADVIFGYGMTELARVSSFYPKTDKHLMESKPTSCGRIAPEISVKIVDAETDEILGPNQTGELHIKSPSLMVGYHNLDSSECFDRDGFLKSGDLGYYDEDKCLYVVGRVKEMFKYLSWHIVPSSIEGVIMEHPAVKEAVVVGVPREEEGHVPAACVVLNEGCSARKEEIETFVAERVTDREQLRGGVVFAKELPRTPTGKVVRKEAQERVLKMLAQ